MLWKIQNKYMIYKWFHARNRQLELPCSCCSLWNLKAINRFYNVSEKLDLESKNMASEFCKNQVCKLFSMVSKLRTAFSQKSEKGIKPQPCFMYGALHISFCIFVHFLFISIWWVHSCSERTCRSFYRLGSWPVSVFASLATISSLVTPPLAMFRTIWLAVGRSLSHWLTAAMPW